MLQCWDEYFVFTFISYQFSTQIPYYTSSLKVEHILQYEDNLYLDNIKALYSMKILWPQSNLRAFVSLRNKVSTCKTFDWNSFIESVGGRSCIFYRWILVLKSACIRWAKTKYLFAYCKMYILVKSYSKLSWHIIAQIENGNTYSLDIFYVVLQFIAFKFL